MYVGGLTQSCVVVFLGMAGALSAPTSGSRTAAFVPIPATIVHSDSYCVHPTHHLGGTSSIRTRSPVFGERVLRISKGLAVLGGSVTPPTAQAGFGLASTWGVLSVIAILLNAVKRLAPIAMQPFVKVAFLILSLASTRTKPNQGGLTGTQWAIYASFAVFMAYAEGFKGFQKKFSPLVVKRALTLDRSPSPGPVKLLLAGPYSMGLFHASRKRRIVSWAVTTSVFSLVQVVKRLPYPWRSIVDVGVVVGLSYGMLSIAAIWVKSLLGTAPEVDPAMPEPRKM